MEKQARHGHNLAIPYIIMNVVHALLSDSDKELSASSYFWNWAKTREESRKFVFSSRKSVTPRFSNTMLGSQSENAYHPGSQ